ncbi:MAG: hypothetical protein IJT32_03265, partial [Lachnospiraceae bacterium]|nr:hypothetical protein [Lachnospiraceae bacterium]
MNLSALQYSDNYSPAADIGVLVVSVVFCILIRIAFIKRSRAFSIFYEILLLIPTAAVCHAVYHMLLRGRDFSASPAVYILMSLHHILLYFVLYLYVYYLHETVNAYGSMGKLFLNLARIGFFAGTVLEVLLYLGRLAMPADEARSVHQFFGGFAMVYFYFVLLIAAVIGVLKTRVYRQVVVGVVATMCVSAGVMILQLLLREESYTTLTFMLPMFALLYLVHSNPYDLESGSVGMSAFEDSVKYSYGKKRA